MASSSRSFQSQTVSRLLAGYRQVAHGAERLLRHGRTALLWGVQVVAFPLYVAFQGVRSAARTLQATKPWQRAVALLTGETPQPLVLTPDSPIRALLSLTQPLAARQSEWGLRPVDRHGELLRQSRAESVMINGQWQLVPLQTPVCGVASDLASRQLVLVTTNNIIFNGLTDLQRDQLQRAITLLMAEYAGWCRRQWHQHQLQSPGLPLPQVAETQGLPVRWFNQILGWMQCSPLAQVTNLFGEAETSLLMGDAHGMATWWERSLAGWPLGQRALASGSDVAADATLAVSPYRSLLVPYGVSHWAGAGGMDHSQDMDSDAGSLVKVGATSVAAQPWYSREVATYRREDGTVVVETRAGSRALDPGASWGDEYVSDDTRTNWGKTMDGGADLKGLPGHDAIEAQVALVNYVDHPLVVVLRWLDALLHRAETWLQRAWGWLRGQP